MPSNRSNSRSNNNSPNIICPPGYELECGITMCLALPLVLTYSIPIMGVYQDIKDIKAGNKTRTSGLSIALTSVSTLLGTALGAVAGGFIGLKIGGPVGALLGLGLGGLAGGTVMGVVGTAMSKMIKNMPDCFQKQSQQLSNSEHESYNDEDSKVIPITSNNQTFYYTGESKNGSPHNYLTFYSPEKSKESSNDDESCDKSTLPPYHDATSDSNNPRV